MDSSSRYAPLVGRFVAWAEAQPDVRAAAIIGSQARRDRPADEWSDLDIVVFAASPGQHVSGAGWVGALGRPWLTFVEPTAAGQALERRVLFEGGLDVDVAFLPAELLPHMAQAGVPGELAAVLRRGASVLLDKDGVLAALSVPAGPPPAAPPTQAEFAELASDFWYHAAWAAKKLRRGELWTAKGCSDDYMKWRLLRMVEWHARAANGWSYDTWHGGRFLERWADPRAVAGLRGAFAAYDAEDLWRGLLATMELFGWLEEEAAAALGFPEPAPGERAAAAYVRELYAGRG